MAKIDYMKVIGVLSKTLRMEATELNFKDRSVDRIEVTMSGQNRDDKKILLSLSDFFLELMFPAGHMNEREFKRWCSAFEYELEQTFFKNVVLEARKEALNYHVRVTI